MVHYVMIRFRGDYFNDEVYADFQDAYAEMVWDLDGLQEACIKAGERLNDNNADLMIRLGLRDLDALNLYMVSDSRRGLLARHGHHMESMTVFDTAMDVCHKA